MDTCFPEQLEDEEVILIKRRHPMLLAADLAAVGLVAAALVAAPFYLEGLGGLYDVVSAGRGKLAYAGLLVLVALFGYARYFNWKYDFFIITNRRVVDSNRYFPFRKVVTEADLDRVQDSTFTVPGAAGAAFGFGDLRIETAGEAADFEWRGIPDPSGMQRALHAAIEARGGRHELS